MNKLLSCRFNMDTNRVEARFEGSTTVAIDCAAVEDEYGNTPVQRAELDWLLYNKVVGVRSACAGWRGGSLLCLGVNDRHCKHHNNVQQ